MQKFRVRYRRKQEVHEFEKVFTVIHVSFVLGDVIENFS